MKFPFFNSENFDKDLDDAFAYILSLSNDEIAKLIKKSNPGVNFGRVPRKIKKRNKKNEFLH